MKTKIGIWFLILVLVLTVIGKKYYSYLLISKAYKSGELITTYELVQEYFDCYRSAPKSKDELNVFAELNKPGLSEVLRKIDYSIMFNPDSSIVTIYSYGFDEIDDSLTIRYFPNVVNFFKSFFIKGDILLGRFKIESPLLTINKPTFYAGNGKLIDLDSLERQSLNKTISNEIRRFYAQTLKMDTLKKYMSKPSGFDRIIFMGDSLSVKEFSHLKDKSGLLNSKELQVFLSEFIKRNDIGRFYIPLDIAKNAESFDIVR